MKKQLINIVSLLVVLIVLVSPLTSVSAEKDNINPQVLKSDRTKDGEIKKESQKTYDLVNDYLENNSISESKELSIQVLGLIDDQLVLLAINGTDKPIKNISFNLTLGDKIIDNLLVESKQSNSGTLDINHAYPIRVKLTSDQIAEYNDLESIDSVGIGNLKVDYVDKTGFWKFYILNLIFSIIAYKLGFARELPLMKSIFVYIMLAVGVFVLTIFSLMDLPITESLIIVSLVLGIYRFRLHIRRKENKSSY